MRSTSDVSNQKMKEQEIIRAKIEFDKLNEYGKREGKKSVKIFALFGTILILFSLITFPLAEPTFKLDLVGLLYLITMAAVSFAILYGAIFILHKWFAYLKENVGFSKTYEIGNDYVKSTVNYDTLNLFNKFSHKKVTKLYGVNIELTIKNDDIRKTKIKKNEIVIYSSRENYPIIIPNEIQYYSSILDYIKHNKNRYKLS